MEGNETTAGFEWANICKEKVVATVMRTDYDIGNLTGGFRGAINNGFMLDWKPLRDCNMCESSGGYCGYNNTGEDEKKFLCFCEDGSITGERCKCMLSVFFFYSANVNVCSLALFLEAQNYLTKLF